jgi:hypothetical protein
MVQAVMPDVILVVTQIMVLVAILMTIRMTLMINPTTRLLTSPPHSLY